MNKEAYLLWKENVVTKKFFKEMQDGLDDQYKNQVFGSTLEQLGLNAAIRKAKIQELTKVLEWKPQEAEDDSND